MHGIAFCYDNFSKKCTFLHAQVITAFLLINYLCPISQAEMCQEKCSELVFILISYLFTMEIHLVVFFFSWKHQKWLSAWLKVRFLQISYQILRKLFFNLLFTIHEVFSSRQIKTLLSTDKISKNFFSQNKK